MTIFSPTVDLQSRARRELVATAGTDDRIRHRAHVSAPPLDQDGDLAARTRI